MHFLGVWRSLVARLLWEQDVGSSNLFTPTINEIPAVEASLGELPVAQLDRASAF